MTYRGHAVLRTLIRCHFSPAETTGGQYIYSGSADGKIHVRFPLNPPFLASNTYYIQIWSLDGRIIQILDRSKTSAMSLNPFAEELEPFEPSDGRGMVCVRDVSWNGNVSPSFFLSVSDTDTD